MKRRQFVGSVASVWAIEKLRGTAFGDESPRNAKYTMDLCPGRIGVKVDQHQAIALAKRYGFQSVEPIGSFLATLDKNALAELAEELKSNGLVWGAAALSVNFRRSDTEFQTGMRELPVTAAAMQRVGVTRVGTYLSSSSDDFTYMANFKLHTDRLRAIAKGFADHHIRFGLEYVGPKTSWTSKKYPFLHTMAETKELIAAIGAPNLGIVLDSWHWHCAGETVDDLMSLTNEQIVAVDLNDAPAGIDRDKQLDNRRELPMATGVIDVKGFLGALAKLHYDGPIRAEPFNEALKAMNEEAAVEATAKAMKKALGVG